MKTCIFSFIAALIVLGLSGCSRHSGEAVSVDVTTTPAFNMFVTNYVAAVNSKDRAKLNGCIHAKSVALLAEDQKFSDEWFGGRFGYSIPAEYTVEATEFPAEKPLPLALDGLVWPVKPTCQVQINFKATPTDLVAMVLWVARENDKWYEVLPSATKKN